MSQVYDFLSKSNVFYLSTISDGMPVTRPFGAIMEYGEHLYFSTANTKAVYQQLIDNSNIQIVSLMPQTRDWLRISANAIEESDLLIKQAMLDNCPILNKHFTVESNNFALFKMINMHTTLNNDQGSTIIS